VRLLRWFHLALLSLSFPYLKLSIPYRHFMHDTPNSGNLDVVVVDRKLPLDVGGAAAHHRHFVNGTRRESLVYFTIGFPAILATNVAVI
jgi:hypothetical protein